MIAVSAVYLAICLLYFRPMLSCGRIFIERDLSVYFIPPRYLWAGLLKSLQLPLWNSHNYSGIPLFATLQPAVLYPPHLFYLFLPFNVVWNWIIILHFPFAGASTYALLRHMKVSRTASFAGGLTFMLSGYLLSVHSLLSHLLAAPWFPLVILFFLKYVETRRVKDVILASLFLVMEFFAGAPEIVIMTFLAIAVMMPFIDSFVGGAPDVPYVARLKGMILLVLIFGLISAVQLLPFYELKMESVRRSGLSYGEATIWSLSWRDFIQFFITDPFGNFSTFTKYWRNQSWLKTIYLGVMPFLLSLFYFLRRDRKQWFFVILAAVSLLLALGGTTPLYQYLYRLPPFNAMRYPVKYLFLFFFTISFTTALGLDCLRKGVAAKDRNTRIAVHVVFYFGFLFAILWGYASLFGNHIHGLFERFGFKPDVYNDIEVNIHNIKRCLFFSFLFCVALVCFLRVKARAWVLLAVMALLTSDLLLANYRYYLSWPWDEYIRKHDFSELMSGKGDDSRYLFSPKSAREFDLFPYDRYAMAPGYASLFNAYALGGAEAFRLANHEFYSGLIERMPSLDHAKRYFNVLGARYLITPYELDDKDFKLLGKTHIAGKKDACLYEFIPFRGRFLFYGTVRFLPEDGKAMETLSNASFDPNSELILSARDGGKPVGGMVKGTVHPVSSHADEMVVDTKTDSDGFLYCADTFYPGWRAYVDGMETNIYRANLAYRAIFVPEGAHRIMFRYVPRSFYAGLMITLFGVGLCLWLVRREHRRE